MEYQQRSGRAQVAMTEKKRLRSVQKVGDCRLHFAGLRQDGKGTLTGGDQSRDIASDRKAQQAPGGTHAPKCKEGRCEWPQRPREGALTHVPIKGLRGERPSPRWQRPLPPKVTVQLWKPVSRSPSTFCSQALFTGTGAGA